MAAKATARQARSRVPNREYLLGVSELYQGEVLGEALFSRLAELAGSPEHRYKLATMLQLESETKVRLRPFLSRLELSVVESEEHRLEGRRMAEDLAALGWQGFIHRFHSQIQQYIDRYEYILSLGPESDRPILMSMVSHERALLSFLSAELDGDTQNSIAAVLEQLAFPLTPP